MLQSCYQTPSEAYQDTLSNVLYYPTFVCSPRGIKIKERLNYSFQVIRPSSAPIVTADEERNKAIAQYTAKEFELYDSMSTSAEEFAIASSFWKKIANPDGTVNSAYGYLIFGRNICGSIFENWNEPPPKDLTGTEPLIFNLQSPGVFRTPWEWAMMSLEQDLDTRQAIMHFSTPNHAWKGVKDFTCTLTAQFLVRDDRLHMIVNMRSNDVVRGLVYDMPWFMSLQERAVKELSERTGKKIQLGSYYHNAGSMHIYEQHWQTAILMLEWHRRRQEAV